MSVKAILLTLFAALTLTVAGCAKEEGPMEKMGKSLDEAAESVSDAAEEAAEDVKDAVND